MDTITRQLARYVIGLRYEDLPLEVLEKARYCILDQLGIQLRGATLPWVQSVYRYVKAMECKPQSLIVYHGDRTHPTHAAFVNATFGHSCELDDGSAGGGHGGIATIPIALALAEPMRVTGKDLITSIVAGYETVFRVGRPIWRKLLEQGWTTKMAIGVFGAVATAGKLLHLSEEQMVNAFGIAGSDTFGTQEYDQAGGEVKRLHGGVAARSGLEAALLAQDGMTAAATIMEGKRGIIRIFGGNPDYSIQDLDKKFIILTSFFKFYPSVGTLHTALDILRGLIKEHDFNYKDIEQINVHLVEWGIGHGCSIYAPTDVASAQFSLAYSLALCLIKKSNDLSLYMDANLWKDPEILALGQKVKAYPLPEAKDGKEFATRVEIKLSDGRILKGYQEFFRGHPLNPATSQELEEKFTQLALTVLPARKVEELKATVLNLDKLTDLSNLWTLLVRD